MSLLLFLAACGGGPPAEPTPLPASVARPVQPTPAYPRNAKLFTLATPAGTPVIVPTATPAPASTPTPGDRGALARLLLQAQTPSGLGVATGGGAIYATPGGRVLAGIPVGGIVTVTGKSADGAWYAVYDDDAVFGWTPAGQLRVYNREALLTVTTAPDPAPVATLLAEANLPVRVLDVLLPTLEARRSAAATPAPGALAAGALPTPTAVRTGMAGIVASEERLNLRAAPDTGAAVVAKLPPGAAVGATGRTAAGDWLFVQSADNSGWVAAEFVRLDGAAAALPVMDGP